MKNSQIIKDSQDINARVIDGWTKQKEEKEAERMEKAMKEGNEQAAELPKTPKKSLKEMREFFKEREEENKRNRMKNKDFIMAFTECYRAYEIEQGYTTDLTFEKFVEWLFIARKEMEDEISQTNKTKEDKNNNKRP
jgi:23S rRNA G2069 N7-methylase RlmK/C1962 C5-methylase RlmI